MKYPIFAGHDVHLETERLLLRPFEGCDFETALPYYQDQEFRSAMEGNRDALVTGDYLERAGEYMARRGYLFAIVEKASHRAIGEVCLEWMNLSRAKAQADERIMRTPIGIWNKTLWGKGYGREIVKCLMAYAFETMRIDRLCAMDVGRDNARSQSLFRSCGFHVAREINDGQTLDLEITRKQYSEFEQPGKAEVV